MKYRLFWSPEADQEIERIVNSESRMKHLLGEAIRSINKQLISDPLNFGESRPDGVRIGFKQPLAFFYEVLEDVQSVILLAIWRTDRR
jgi:plasmid stabilization system protein ParE